MARQPNFGAPSLDTAAALDVPSTVLDTLEAALPEFCGSVAAALVVGLIRWAVRRGWGHPRTGEPARTTDRSQPDEQ
ncbi:hypothetical protein [Streptomyces sp. NPDC047525]|uniref:hypothetical protein n=1 Tax=Streptomyces sp. NPDC047525 TaxID=3155264 RepID=UPI0033DA7B56